ncbi:MAG TPA: ATP-binding protein [Ktedonobacteraceae bacterium]|nr:ATP-binding protein [Ktedonobacteraceae bacterium]
MQTIDLENRELLEDFKTLKVKHPRQEEIQQFLWGAILGHRRYTLVDLYGMSGVGKSTVMGEVAQMIGSAETDPAVVPSILIQGSPEDMGSQARLDYYQQILDQVQHHPAIRDRTKNLPLYVNRGKKSSDPVEWLQMRNAVEYALALLRVKVVFVDEAQHLLAPDPVRKPTAQLDWLKALANRTNVLHVLGGNFDLYEYCHLSGQVVRRMRDQHFPRYHLDNQKECEEFVGALKSLLEHIPLSVDVGALLERWRWFGEWSVGCVGVLGDWIVDTVDALWRKGETVLTVDALTKHALQPDQRARLEMEARIGENRVARAKAQSEQELQQLLSTPALDGKSQDPSSAPSSNGVSRARGNRIERALSRDPVGESANAKPSGKCPGSGQVLDLDVQRFTQSAVVHVQCRECGSIRKGLLKEDHIVCRDHEKLRGRSTHTGPRWVEHEGQWNVVAK